jgi:hypothetical protein
MSGLGSSGPGAGRALRSRGAVFESRSPAWEAAAVHFQGVYAETGPQIVAVGRAVIG